jgi:hypothetical protein
MVLMQQRTPTLSPVLGFFFDSPAVNAANNSDKKFRADEHVNAKNAYRREAR